MIKHEFTTDEWQILVAVAREGHIEYKKDKLFSAVRAHEGALQVGVNIKIEVQIFPQYTCIYIPTKVSWRPYGGLVQF